jgi:hypothetical protein
MGAVWGRVFGGVGVVFGVVVESVLVRRVLIV